jgi:hypothetical protein
LAEFDAPLSIEIAIVEPLGFEALHEMLLPELEDLPDDIMKKIVPAAAIATMMTTTIVTLAITEIPVVLLLPPPLLILCLISDTLVFLRRVAILINFELGMSDQVKRLEY